MPKTFRQIGIQDNHFPGGAGERNTPYQFFSVQMYSKTRPSSEVAPTESGAEGQVTYPQKIPDYRPSTNSTNSGQPPLKLTFTLVEKVKGSRELPLPLQPLPAAPPSWFEEAETVSALVSPGCTIWMRVPHFRSCVPTYQGLSARSAKFRGLCPLQEPFAHDYAERVASLPRIFRDSCWYTATERTPAEVLALATDI